MAGVEPVECFFVSFIFLLLFPPTVLQSCHSAKKAWDIQELLGQHTRQPSWQLFITHTGTQGSQTPSRYRMNTAQY